MRHRALMLVVLLGLVGCCSPTDPVEEPDATLTPARCYRIIDGETVFFHCDSLPPDPFYSEDKL